MAERNVLLNIITQFKEERKGALRTGSVVERIKKQRQEIRGANKYAGALNRTLSKTPSLVQKIKGEFSGVVDKIRKQKEAIRKTSGVIGKMGNSLKTVDGIVKTLRSVTTKLRGGFLDVFEVLIEGARHVSSLGGSLGGVLDKLKRLSREGVVGIGHLIKTLGLSVGAANMLRTALRGVARFAITSGRLLLRFAGPIGVVAAVAVGLYKSLTHWEGKLAEAKAKGIKLDERRVAVLSTRLKLQRGLSAANRIRSDARTRNLDSLTTRVALQRTTQARDIARDDFRTSRSMALGSRDPAKIRDAAKALGEYRSREEALGEVQKRRLTDQARG